MTNGKDQVEHLPSYMDCPVWRVGTKFYAEVDGAVVDADTLEELFEKIEEGLSRARKPR